MHKQKQILKTSQIFIESPVGILQISASAGEVEKMQISKQAGVAQIQPADKAILQATQNQLKKYFLKQNKNFKLPLKIQGTDFQKKVWREMAKIPYGETRSYGELAKAIGQPKASRAIGGACNKNPFLIIVPCHRVVSATGLGGFAYGDKIKRQLLNIEKQRI